MSNDLKLSNLWVTLGPKVIAQLDLTVRSGQIVTIMGPSGSGKSTLLAAILGNLDPAFRLTGQIILGTRDITCLPIRDRRVGVLFQDDLLFPHMSVGGNLGFALPRTVKGTARTKRIDRALAEAGLEGFAPRDPATLSGGQRARVALIRTLLAEPQALLLDEPFARLDLDLRAQIRAQVFDHIRATGLPTLLVTHDPADARAAQGPVLSPMGEAVSLPNGS
jgi:putative thiamine transport system ATP-binding protein